MILTSSATFLIHILRIWLSLRRSAVTFSALVSFYVDVMFELLLMAVDTGQVYYTLLQEREEKGINDVAISRVEQLSPFPYDLVRIEFVGSYGIGTYPLHRSHLISTSTPTLSWFGLRYDVWSVSRIPDLTYLCFLRRNPSTMAPGHTSLLVFSPLLTRQSTTRASTPKLSAVPLLALLRLVAR